MKKPPDKYKCLKVNVKSILKNTEPNILYALEDAIHRANNITFKAYLLLKLWILDKYKQKIEIPEITQDIIKMAFKSVCKKSAGPKPKNDNLKLLVEFTNLHSFELENGNQLSQILSYYATTMITSIENNIKKHFMDYINRFVNVYFKYKYREEIINKEFKKQLMKEINVLKNDIKNNTLKSDKKYHPWLKQYRYQIIPKKYNKSYFYDIKENPYKYIKHMIFMNLAIEKLDGKTFQVLPLQTSIIPKHIQIDTKSIIELFIVSNKKEYLDNLSLYREILWDKYFNITQKIKGYSFDYTIITNGYSSSLRFINNNELEKENTKKEKMRKGRKLLKGLSDEEKEKIRNNKIEQSKKKDKKETKENEQENKEIVDYPYIDEVCKDELKGKHIFIDPGKRSLLTMMDDKGIFLSYTNKERIKSTKRLLYHTKIKTYKDKKGISDTENKLTGYSSKTCNIEKFKEYINAKIKINDDLNNLYKEKIFRQYKWYSYINTKRTEDKMVNKIIKKYDKDSIIIMGDWSIGKQMRNFISTPNLSIKRKLSEKFKIYNIDEYKTSILNYKTEERSDNLYLPDNKNIFRKQHSILTYQMENKRKGCINRDKNGCKNIQKIFVHYLKTGERPLNYQR
jgi:hypothetical protein